MMDQSRPARRRAMFPGKLPTARGFASALVLLAGGSGLATGQPLTERVEHSVEIGGDFRVTVMNFAGHVEVHGTDPGEDRTLRIVGVKRLEADLPPEEAARIFERTNLDLRRRGRHIAIGPRPQRGPPGRRGADRTRVRPDGETPITEIRAPRNIPPVSVDLELWLPEGASLEVRTFSAPITVTGVAASEGHFLLRSISGDLTVRGLNGHDLRAETVSGALRLTDVVSLRSNLKTLTASIRLDGQLHPKGWYEIQTHSGPVALALGGLPAFQIEARTYVGEIRNDLEVAGPTGPRSLEYRHGDGGPQITVDTFSGRVHLVGAAGSGSPPERGR